MSVLRCYFLAFLLCVSFAWIQGDDLDQAYDSISAFSSRRNNQEAVFGAEESIKEVRLDLHITYGILYFLFHAYYKALWNKYELSRFLSLGYRLRTKFIDRWCSVKCFFSLWEVGWFCWEIWFHVNFLLRSYVSISTYRFLWPCGVLYKCVLYSLWDISRDFVSRHLDVHVWLIIY